MDWKLKTVPTEHVQDDGDSRPDVEDQFDGLRVVLQLVAGAVSLTTLRQTGVRTQLETFLIVKLLLVVNSHSQTRHEETHQKGGYCHQGLPSKSLNQSDVRTAGLDETEADLNERSANESPDKSDEARDNGGDVGAGGDANVLE